MALKLRFQGLASMDRHTFTLPIKPIIYDTMAPKVRFQVLARHGQAYPYNIIASERVSSVSLAMDRHTHTFTIS